jgi:hypothetical protein
VKDLRIFSGIDLKDVLIVDNYVYSFAFHLENGIPIVPFIGQKDDQELIKVIKYITDIHEKPDLRVPNNENFQLKKIFNSNIESFIKHYDFDLLSDFSQEDYPDIVTLADKQDSSESESSRSGSNSSDNEDCMTPEQVVGEKGGTENSSSLVGQGGKQ